MTGPEMVAGPETFRIVQVVGELSRVGGIETVAFELQRCWDRGGVPSDVLTARADGSVSAERVRLVLPSGLSRWLPVRGRWRYLGAALLVPSFTLAASLALRRGLRAGGWAEGAVILSHGDSFVADAIVLHAINAASLAEKRAQGQWRWRLNPMHLWVEARDRRMLRGLRARRYVAVSRRIADELVQFHGVPRERIAVIPNGVDIERFSPAGERAGLRRAFGIPDGSRLLLFAGHEFDRKGLAPLIEALAEPGLETAHVVAAGKGDADRYRRLAERVGVADRVHFAGPRADMPAVFRDADAFVLPTAYEAFSLVCMEALACGVPVLATRTGGIEDYLVDGGNGFFIERDPVSIASALSRTFASPSGLTQLRAAARSSALDFAWPAVAKQYHDLLKQCWAEKWSGNPGD